MVNFNGRIISDPERFQMGKFKKSHLNSVKTAAGNERVLNLNKTSKRTALDQKLQQAGPKDIYLKLDQRQAIKLSLAGPMTRAAFNQALRTAIDAPDADLDLKYKASLIGVYKKLMSSSHTPLPNAHQLQLTEQTLMQKLQHRIPNSGHLNQLQQLMPHYASPVEALDKRLDQLFSDHGAIEANDPNFQVQVERRAQVFTRHFYDLLQAQHALDGDDPDDFDVQDQHLAKQQAIQHVRNDPAQRAVVWGEFIYDEYYSAIHQQSPLSDSSATGYDNYYADLAQIANNRVDPKLSVLQYTKDHLNANYEIGDFYHQKQLGNLDQDTLTSAQDDFFYFQTSNSTGPSTQRVYINVKADEAAGLMDELVQLLDHPVDGVGINGVKVNGPESAGMRADTIVVYTASQAANDRVVAFLQGKNPNIFGSNTPELTESVFPGVATGDEVPAHLSGLESFGGLRSKAIAEALVQLPGTGTRADFQDLVEARLAHHGLDANRVDRNQ